MLGWMVLIRELMQIFLDRAIKFPGAIVLAQSAFRGDLAENGQVPILMARLTFHRHIPVTKVFQHCSPAAL